jgi:hypothetical protein
MEKTMDYEDRLIIYLDILGFSSFVNYTTLTKLNTLEKIKKIDMFLSMLKKFFYIDKKNINVSSTRQVTSFSDLIVISINLKEIDNLDYEISEVFYLLLNSLCQGFLLRGAIVYGKLIHTYDSIFGTGLIDAYNKERTIAKYPRVIIDDVIISDLHDLQNREKYGDIKRDTDDFISRDSDGLYFIDIFKSLREYADNFWQYTKILSSICDILSAQIGAPLLLEKYTWLRDKFIAHVNEYSKLFDYSFENTNVTRDLSLFKACLADFDEKEYREMV